VIRLVRLEIELPRAIAEEFEKFKQTFLMNDETAFRFFLDNLVFEECQSCSNKYLVQAFTARDKCPHCGQSPFALTSVEIEE
jgi:Zn finger protein HypA/HybF involved in hydrogenase expression